MSQSLSSQTKQWAAGIQDNEFRKIRKEIQNYYFDDETTKTKAMLRLLIYLCQTATKSPPTDLQAGQEMSKLSCTLCKNIQFIPELPNYFSSLYHIIRALLDIKLFEEAMSTCNYLLPPSQYHQQVKETPEVLSTNYSKLISIFHVSLDKLLRNSSPGSITPQIFQQILTSIKYILNIEVLTNTDGSKNLLLKLLHYTELLEPLNPTKEEFDEFVEKFFLKYLGSISLHLGDKNRLSTYQNFTKIITKLSNYYMKHKRLESLNKILKKYLKNFETCMLETRESSKCHQLFKDFVNTFIKPSKDHLKEDSEQVKDLIEQIQALELSYGLDGILKYSINSISSILESLFSHWVDPPPPEFTITSTKLLNHLSEAIKRLPMDHPCSCGNEDCSIVHNKNKSVQLKNKILSVLHKMHPKTQNVEFYEQFTLTSSQIVDMIPHFQEKKCEKWKNLWLNATISIYNFTFNFSNDHERSAELNKFLATSLIKLKRTEDDQIYFSGNPTSPLSLTLHRLSNLYYGNHQYQEARIFTAINVYLNADDAECKGYRNWSFIHHQEASCRGLTLVDFLKKNSSDLRVLGLKEISLKRDVLRKICLREIKSHIGMKIDLSESIIAVLHRLEALNAGDITYATAVHQLGSHCLNFQPRVSIYSYVKNALSRLKSIKPKSPDSDQIQYLISHLKLYEAIEEIRELEESTKTEMKDTSIKLYAVPTDGVSTKGSNVVPAFSQINVATAEKLASRLEHIYDLWEKSFTLDSIKKWNSWDGTSSVKSVIIAGEYSRFYRYKDLEVKFWKMAYDLAVGTNEHQWIVYITGRAVLSRYINEDWIQKSTEIISAELSASKESKVLGIISMFKMSLADYYYSLGRTEDADELFDAGKRVTTLDLSENCGTFIFSQHLLLTHKFHRLPPEKKNNLEYTEILANTLYAMLLLDDMAFSTRDVIWSLYELDMLMEVSCHISSRMNSLYSFREITAHLARRLKIYQPKISVLRVAEILKYLCIIDLSRNQLEDCEVKLQGLEHILQIENFESSMQQEFLKVRTSCLFQTAISPDRALTDPMRDIPQNDTSPILRRERFAPPQFLVHEEKCKCFGCVNEAYKFLVFSCTHIRAQLYYLQKLKQYARQHFEGALKISEGLIKLSGKDENHQHYYVIDYILFLLDYVRFLKGDSHTYEEGRKIVSWALEICDIYKLECHPVYMSSMEIAFEYEFEVVFPGVLPRSSLVIPRIDQIDISEYMDPEWHSPELLCVTPAKESGNSPRPGSRSPRRRKQGPLLTFSKASVDVVESDSEDLSPAPSEKPKKKVVTRVKPVRRRLEDDDFGQDEDAKSPEVGDLKGKVIKLIDGAVLAAPDLSRKLHALRKTVSDVGVDDDAVEKLIGILEVGKAEYEKPRERSRTRRAIVSSETTIMDVQGVEEIVKKAKRLIGRASSGKSSRGSGRKEREGSSVGETLKKTKSMIDGAASGKDSSKSSRTSGRKEREDSSVGDNVKKTKSMISESSSGISSRGSGRKEKEDSSVGETIKKTKSMISESSSGRDSSKSSRTSERKEKEDSSVASSGRKEREDSSVRETLKKPKIIIDGRSSSKSSRTSERKEKEDSSVAEITKKVETLSVRPSGAKGRTSKNSSTSGVSDITKKLETLSVRTLGVKGRNSRSSSTSRIPEIKVDEEESVNSDDEVVETSYVEPRRSRRLVRINSMTDTKSSRKK